MSESVDAPSPPESARLPWLRALAFVGAALLVPGIPFLFFGEDIETAITRMTQASWTTRATFAGVVAVLSADLMLPVPSSAVSTFAGNRLGITGGIAAVWLGMTFGAILGFALARWAGPALAQRLAPSRDVERLSRFGRRHGRTLLVVTRPLPLFAEAAVVLAGTWRQSWRDFLVPVCLSNLALAAAYAWLGHASQGPGQLALALAGSIILPLGLTFVIGWLLEKRSINEGVTSANRE